MTMIMTSTTAENLKQHFDSFINQERQLEFFVGLGDYVNYIFDTTLLKRIVDEVMKEKSRVKGVRSLF